MGGRELTGSPNVAVDVHYPGNGGAVAAAIAFTDWASDRIDRTEVMRIGAVRPYRPGRFFERELPCILAVLARFDATPATVVVDGYVTLGGDDARDGLGAHLFAALGVPVIGVAKSRFKGTPTEAEVLRGRSTRPLFVTARGVALEEAKRLVRGMHGPYRLPTLLAAVDRACREG